MNTLTTTFTVALAVLITGCSYGSMYEAREACDEWEAADKKLTYTTAYTQTGHKRTSTGGYPIVTGKQ